MSAFTCPLCGASCPTLRDWLTCHPRELRTLTTLLETPRFGRLPLGMLYRGDYSPTLYAVAFGTEDVQDESEAA